MLASLWSVVWFLVQLNVLIVVTLAFIALALCCCSALYLRLRPVQQPSSTDTKLVVGFFHPYCNSGGGGERVLWQCIHALHDLSPNIHCVVYTGDVDSTEKQILDKAQERFHLPSFTRSITFQYIHNRRLLSASNYPHFTLLFQSLASLPVAFYALCAYKPHIYIDTTGAAFTYPLASLLFGCSVACYTHYPTISTDMLQLVYQRRPAYNHNVEISSSRVKNAVKLAYYLAFTVLYSLVGQSAQLVMVNSSWTYQHIVTLWRRKHRIRIVYPPCDTQTLQTYPLLTPRLAGDKQQKTHDDDDRTHRDDVILSVGQFRPEKDHTLQLQAFAAFLQKMKTHTVTQTTGEQVRLVILGGVRDEQDQQRVDELKLMAKQLGIEVNTDRPKRHAHSNCVC